MIGVLRKAWLSIASVVLVATQAASFQRYSKLAPLRSSASVTPGKSWLLASSLDDSDPLGLNAPPKYICEVVKREAKANNRRLSVSDATVESGMDLSKTKRDLMTLAYFTGAIVEVDENGELYYSFPADFEAVLAKKSLGRRLQIITSKVYPALFYGVRVAFGAMLLVSLFITVASVVVLSSSSSSDSDDRRDSRGNQNRPSVSLNFFSYPYGAFDFYPTYYDKRPWEMNFLESCYSYIFGDENPNKGKDVESAKIIASLARTNNGILTGEMVAPYVPKPPNSQIIYNQENSNLVDESWILPYLVKFNGFPTVTEEGDIIYQFSELLGNQDLSITTGNSALPKPLLEEELQFSKARLSDQNAAKTLGVANLVGVLWLGSALTKFLRLAEAGSVGGLGPSSFAFLQLVSKAYPFLCLYAVLFNVIPLIRFMWIKKENKDIDQRNKERLAWFSALKEPTESIERKLQARNETLARINTGDKRGRKILYSTALDMQEQEEIKIKEAERFS